MNAIYILTGVGVLSLLSEILNFKKYIVWLAVLGLVATLVFTVADWGTSIRYFNDMVYFDNYAVAFSALLAGVGLLWLLLSKRFFESNYHVTDYTALVVFALVGAVLMVSFSNMVVLFIGIEIISLSMYVMAGSRKNDLLSNEAALKYFLLGSFATGFLLFGIALVYGASGSFYLAKIAQYSATVQPPVFYYTGIVLIFIALAFKVSAVPFHFWAPDVYQGAPVSVTSYMATIVKTAAFAAFFRLFYTAFAGNSDVWWLALSIITVLTLAVGNIIAVQQTNAKRLLAYSSLAHAGYLLMALMILNSYSAGAILYYAASYSLATLLSFFVLDKVNEYTKTNDIGGFKGLYKKSPLLAFVLVLSLLSLAGIPPMAGFFAKYYLFAAALKSGLLWLVITGVVASLISIIYYFKVVAAAFSQPDEAEVTPIPVPAFQKVVIVLMALGLIVLGILPNLVFGLI